MDSVNIIKGVVYNIGTQATSYTATSAATSVANLRTIDGLPTVSRKLRPQTLNADAVESFKPGRRVAVSDVTLTVYLVTAGYNFGGTATASYRVDIPIDTTNTAATTDVQMFCPSAVLHSEQLSPGGEEQEAGVALSIRPGAVPVFGTASY